MSTAEKIRAIDRTRGDWKSEDLEDGYAIGHGEAIEAAARIAERADADHKAEMAAKDEEIERLRLRLLSAAGDDLCRLTQEEIKAYTSGAVQIPPEEEFIPSCRRFHAQIASEAGVLEGCLTLAQLIAENERLRSELAAARKEPNG